VLQVIMLHYIQIMCFTDKVWMSSYGYSLVMVTPYLFSVLMISHINYSQFFSSCSFSFSCSSLKYIPKPSSLKSMAFQNWGHFPGFPGITKRALKCTLQCCRGRRWPKNTRIGVLKKHMWTAGFTCSWKRWRRQHKTDGRRKVICGLCFTNKA